MEEECMMKAAIVDSRDISLRLQRRLKSSGEMSIFVEAKANLGSHVFVASSEIPDGLLFVSDVELARQSCLRLEELVLELLASALNARSGQKALEFLAKNRGE